MQARAHTAIVPETGWRAVDFGALWSYRELLWFLALRDIKVRYKQTALGAAWAILQPITTMVIFTVVFGRLAGLAARSPGGVPYPLYSLAALLPWQLFAGTLSNASNSLVANQHLLSKVYFPRLVIPLSAALSGLVDFVLALAVLLAMMLFYGVAPAVTFLLAPLFVLYAVIAALAVGLWLSALNVAYRDVRHVVPFVVQAWMLITPVAYPSSIVPTRFRLLYDLNPVAGVVEGFRWAVLGVEAPGGSIFMSAIATAVLLVSGLIYFRRMERKFADLV